MSTGVPAVSVIVPNYNHARFLRQRLESVFSQTFQDFEVLLLDDASSDESVALLREYERHPKVRALLVNARNSGVPFLQWNRGVALARGRYVWLAESDDWADPGFLELLVAALERWPEAGLALAASTSVDETGRLLGRVEDGFWSRAAGGAWHDGRWVLAQAALRRNPIPNASAVLFRRSAYEQAGGADESMRLCGDWLIWVKMLLGRGAVFVDQPLNFFRCHAATVRNRRWYAPETLRERAAVARVVLGEVTVDAALRSQWAEELFSDWLEAERDPGQALSLRDHLRTFGALKGLDPELHRRLRKWARHHGELWVRARLRPLKWFLGRSPR